VNAELVLAPDATMALGIASTAMPFARTPEAQAERWLRILRLHGQAGAALQSLGVGERPLPGIGGGEQGLPGIGVGEQRLEAPEEHGEGATADVESVDDPEDGDPVERVGDRAAAIARRRGTPCLATTDLLLAVMDVYGRHFDRVLESHGTDRQELTDRLGAG
jgi:hypothetical protein